MNFLIKGLFIVLVLQGSNAGLFSNTKNLINKVSDGVQSNVNSIVNTASNSKVLSVLDNLSLTKDGILDLNGIIQTYNLSSVINLVQKSITLDGKINVKTLIDSFNLEELNLVSIFSSISTKILEAVGTITNNVDLIDYLTTILVKDSEDGKLDFTGLAKKYIGKVEEYDVTTEDGYVLKLFHIPGDVRNTVLHTHGLFSSSDDAILRGNTSLLYSLVQNNCDVWAMNFRGNSYSRKHVTLDPDTDSKFWEFSMNEWGYYDLPAVIDFILKKTNQQKLSVVGFSEGSAATIILTSRRPEYNNKIKVFVAMSPVCYLSNSGLALQAIIRAEPAVNELLVTFGAEELFGKKKIEKKIYRLLCSQGLLSYKLCYQLVLGAVAGYSPENVEPAYFTSTLGHYPEGSSRMNLIHYLQVGNSGKFAQYDFGRENYEKYGAREPPVYDLQKVTCNVSILVAPNDKIFGLKDGERVRSELPNVVSYHVVEDDYFNHVDFLYSNNAHELVYPRVINTLNKYNNV